MLLAASGLDEFYKYFDQVRFPNWLHCSPLSRPVPKTAMFKAGHSMFKAGHSMFDAMTHASDLKARVLFLVEQPLEMEYVM